MLVALLSVACSFQPAIQPSIANEQSLTTGFERVEEVWQLLEQQHINRSDLDSDKISEAAIRGILESLDDPYASFLDAEQFSMESQDVHGSFEGIGAHVGILDEKITIIAPMPDSPAEKAGIRSGDIILGINGDSTADTTLLEAVSKIRGEKGTTVDLLILHANEPIPVTITVRRGVIQIDSVTFQLMPNDIGYIHISNFTESTKSEVEGALREFEEETTSGALILDLRNNPGGLLNSVVDVTSLFIDDGLVLYEIDGSGARKDWPVRNNRRKQDYPMVVLINQFSASASEVLCGALMDHERATIIGTKSFGKGSVNILRSLSDGSGIYFTVAHWFTPKGTLIEGAGIEPDVVVDISPDTLNDIQIEKALEILNQKREDFG
ncbi:MAG: peptidase S41 [Chloroflexi bacterium]|nr:peptidase S41 [Chloroflexota bacterium]